MQSTLGQGSSFWFTAVLEPARTAVARDLAVLPPPSLATDDWQGLRILEVDDNPLNRAVTQGMLHAQGLHTDIAEDGAQALLQLQTVGPSYYSCVLMDMQMPHMDGMSATKALRQLPGFAHLPIIAMIAHTELQDVARAHAAGMNAHLGKPIMESALHAVLQEWLPLQNNSPEATPATVSAVKDFDTSAIDALTQLLDTTKLQQLLTQFSTDSLRRAQQLPLLAQKKAWPAMRAEVHKLSGTAATFGLMRLEHLSSALSVALHLDDAQRATDLADQINQSAQAGMAQLQAYCATLSPHT